MRFRKVQKVQPDPCFNKSAASKKCNLAPAFCTITMKGSAWRAGSERALTRFAALLLCCLEKVNLIPFLVIICLARRGQRRKSAQIQLSKQ